MRVKGLKYKCKCISQICCETLFGTDSLNSCNIITNDYLQKDMLKRPVEIEKYSNLQITYIWVIIVIMKDILILFPVVL